MTAADLAAARALCVSEDLSTWSMERLYGALYRLHAVLPRVLDECERLARVHTGHVEYGSAEHQEMYTPLAVRLMGERDEAIRERDVARSMNGAWAEGAAEALRAYDEIRAELARLQDWARAKLYAQGEPRHDRHVAEIARLTAEREQWRPVVEAAKAYDREYGPLGEADRRRDPLSVALDAMAKEQPHGE